MVIHSINSFLTNKVHLEEKKRIKERYWNVEPVLQHFQRKVNCIFYFVSDLWCLIFRKALELSILYYLVILISHMQSKGKLFKRKSKAYTLTEKRDKINTFANYQNIIKRKRVPPLTTIFLFFLKTATSSPGPSFFQFDGVRKEDPGTQQIARTKSPRLALGNIG